MLKIGFLIANDTAVDQLPNILKHILGHEIQRAGVGPSPVFASNGIVDAVWPGFSYFLSVIGVI